MQTIDGCRRQKEMEEKLIEEEVARRVEEIVAKRVEEEMEKRKEEIEAEVLRRIEDAKRAMEAEMLAELERKREAELKAQQIKEVKLVDRLSDADVHRRRLLTCAAVLQMATMTLETYDSDILQQDLSTVMKHLMTAASAATLLWMWSCKQLWFKWRYYFLPCIKLFTAVFYIKLCIKYTAKVNKNKQKETQNQSS